MTTTINKLLTCCLALGLFACNNAAPTPETTETEKTATDTTTAPPVDTAAAPAVPYGTVMTLNAMFVEFSLGDAEHYVFKDQAGKTWDFGANEDKSVTFGKELPEAQANETNQGWTSNKALQNKWFMLKYTIRQQPQYQDGPMADVPVILEAKQL